MTVNVLCTCSLVKHVEYIVEALLLRDSTLDGIIIKTQRETRGCTITEFFSPTFSK